MKEVLENLIEELIKARNSPMGYETGGEILKGEEMEQTNYDLENIRTGMKAGIDYAIKLIGEKLNSPEPKEENKEYKCPYCGEKCPKGETHAKCYEEN